MNSSLLRGALAFALGLANASGALAQDTPAVGQQNALKELEAARAALEEAARRYISLSVAHSMGAQAQRNAPRKPVIGVILTTAEEGVRIAGVTLDSAAAAAGLKSGDILVAIDGQPLDASNASLRTDRARALLATLDTTRPVTLDYKRDGKAGRVSITPKLGERVLAVPGGMRFDGNVAVLANADGNAHKITADNIHGGVVDALWTLQGVNAPREVSVPSLPGKGIRVNIGAEVVRLIDTCKETACQLSPLVDALRWNGLNLASVDTGLGRYFGTDSGVLVLHTDRGELFEHLQPGDVILQIADKPVTSPQDVMEQLRALAPGGKTTMAYLRDQKPATATIKKSTRPSFTVETTPPDSKSRASSITVFDDTQAQ